MHRCLDVRGGVFAGGHEQLPPTLVRSATGSAWALSLTTLTIVRRHLWSSILRSTSLGDDRGDGGGDSRRVDNDGGGFTVSSLWAHFDCSSMLAMMMMR